MLTSTLFLDPTVLELTLITLAVDFFKLVVSIVHLATKNNCLKITSTHCQYLFIQSEKQKK